MCMMLNFKTSVGKVARCVQSGGNIAFVKEAHTRASDIKVNFDEELDKINCSRVVTEGYGIM